MRLNDLLTEEEYQELAKKLPVVVRVHGEHHGELAEVGVVFDRLLQVSGDEVKECLEKLSEISSGFQVPEDACPTYERVYELLKKAALA